MTPETIAVAMSGGVDSSVAAALLKEQGHDVVGITALAKRAEIFRWLDSCAATRMTPATVRRLVRRVKEERA